MRELADGVWQLSGFPPNNINVYLLGDVMWGANPFLLRSGVREPYPWASPDPERSRASARRLAELEPALVCFGHGPPVRDTAVFTAAVARLPG
jgi:glyoxylase-like metal-dependent hydrolase (beta-lactamase superfamily II)